MMAKRNFFWEGGVRNYEREVADFEALYHNVAANAKLNLPAPAVTLLYMCRQHCCMSCIYHRHG